MMNRELISKVVGTWNMFCLNYNYPTFIEKAFASLEESTINHYKGKFKEAYDTYGSSGAMLIFWAGLDRRGKALLEDWVMDNCKEK